MNDGIKSKIHVLERSLTKSQVFAARERQLQAEAEGMLPLDWMRIYGELQNLRECVHFKTKIMKY